MVKTRDVMDIRFWLAGYSVPVGRTSGHFF